MSAARNHSVNLWKEIARTNRTEQPRSFCDLGRRASETHRGKQIHQALAGWALKNVITMNNIQLQDNLGFPMAEIDNESIVDSNHVRDQLVYSHSIYVDTSTVPVMHSTFRVLALKL